jgi:UMF1 family MFS transporter
MDSRAVRAWVMYDWANSAFSSTVMATVMPIFFFDVAGRDLDATKATAYWGYTQSIALVLIVLLSPVLGAIADAGRFKRKFLLWFTWIGIASSLLMATIGPGEWVWASILVTFGTLGFSGGNVFYDAFLSDVVPESERDRVSARGYAFGYIGGGILLALNLAVIIFHNMLGITTLAATQASFFSVGIWWWLFSLPLFHHVHDRPSSERPPTPAKHLVAEGIRAVWQTLRSLHRYPEMLKFLIAFWFFSDGINTIIKMATIYGREIGIGQTDLIAALLITQFVGIPLTLLFGRLADQFGPMPSLISSLVVYLLIVMLGYFMTTALHFYLLAILVGCVQGGSQALSRSIFSRLVPVHRTAEFFGFFGLSGKFAAVFGPAVFGLVGQWFGSSRLGILSIALFFLVGILLLFAVDLEKGKAEAHIAERETPAVPATEGPSAPM